MSIPKINYHLKTSLSLKGQEYDLDPALNLLREINKLGNLQSASLACNYSYRKAWNILKNAENYFGQPLVEKQRGKGSQLSKLGELLLQSTISNTLLLEEILQTAENKINASLNSFFSSPQTLRIVASDSEKLDKLRQRRFPIELHIDGSGQALLAYAEGKCEMAGFHIGTGKNSKAQIENYLPYLDPKHDIFLVLEQRQQGLISHPQQPVTSFQQMIEQHLTFVNRQHDSGTRTLLNSLLAKQNITPEQLNGYYHEEHTHLAVASMVSSRQADAGLGIQSAANRLKLHFTPVSSEIYFLVFNKITPEIQHILEKLTDKTSLETINYKQFIHLIHS